MSNRKILQEFFSFPLKNKQIHIYRTVVKSIVGAANSRPPNILHAKYWDLRRKYCFIAFGDCDLLHKSHGRLIAAPTMLYDRLLHKPEFEEVLQRDKVCYFHENPVQ